MTLEVIMFILLALVLTWEFASFKRHRRREEDYQAECDRLLREILSVVKPGDPDDA